MTRRVGGLTVALPRGPGPRAKGTTKLGPGLCKPYLEFPAMDQETKHTLQQAVEEIRSLRRANDILAAKVDVMELFAVVLHSQPARKTTTEGEDIAWKLEQLLLRQNT